MNSITDENHVQETKNLISHSEQMTVERWFDFFSRVTSELVGSENLDTLMRKITLLPVPSFADAGVLFLNEIRNNPAGFASAKGYKSAAMKQDLLRLYSPHEGRLLSPDDVNRSGQPAHLRVDPELTNHRISSLLCLPLKVGADVLGSLALCLLDGREFSVGDITVLESYTHRCALVLQNTYMQKKLEQEKLKLAAITNALPAQVAYIDKKGNYRFCNQSYRSWFGLQPSSVVDQNVAEVIGEDNLDRLKEIQKSALAGFTGSLQTKLANQNEERWVEVSDIPDIAADGSISGFVELIYDLTEKKKIEEQLKTAKEEADSANKAKSRFLANVSHEVRTPINVVLGFADLIINSKEPVETKIRWARKIYENGEHLLKIVNDILETSKIDSDEHRITIEKKSVDLRQLLDEVLGSLFPVAQRKNIELLSQFNLEEKDRIIETDRTRLKQILLNLVGNAIKFTDNGHVKVTVNKECANHVAVLISDTGCGISENEVINLFKPFYQVPTTRVQPLNGTGLGLALSRKLANLLGGDVVIDRTDSEGSVFRLSLPKDVRHEDTHQNPAGGIKQSIQTELLSRAFSHSNILVTDDCEDSRELTALFLRGFGAKVTMAANGHEGIELAMTQNFDLMLTDVLMPDLSGHQVAAILRDQNFQKPIVALTANAFGEELEECIKAGCDSALSKPITRERLFAHLRPYLVRAN